MTFKVLIPTNNSAYKIQQQSKALNKSLVAIENKPLIAHIIEKFPENAEFVIAVGKNSNLIKEFLSTAYPERNFEFVVNDNQNSSFDFSSCKQYLQCPFVFHSCEATVNESIPEPENNWMAFTLNNNSHQLERSLKINNGYIDKILEQGEKGSETYPYLNIAAIHDYKKFWSAMDFESSSQEIILPDNFDKAHIKNLITKQGETWGLRSLLKNKFPVEALQFTLNESQAHIKHESTDNNFISWNLNNTSIIFSPEADLISKQLKRAELLQDYIPEIKAQSKHMFSYEDNKSIKIAKQINLKIFKQLLNHCKNFWQTKKLDEKKLDEFNRACHKHYKTQTEHQLNKYYKLHQTSDQEEMINGLATAKTEVLLSKLDWARVAKGEASRIHGNLVLENVVLQNKQLKFINWAPEYPGLMEAGDIYYDLAKLNYSLLFSPAMLERKDYYVKTSEKNMASRVERIIDFDFTRQQSLVSCQSLYLEWLEKNGFSSDKVKVICSLICLNLAAEKIGLEAKLHYYIAKSMLSESLSPNEPSTSQDLQSLVAHN